MRSIRVWYKKDGLAKYISHLDLNRCMTRAVRRAGIPLWYTEGFNPRPYLNFLLALPLGQEAESEPMDMRIDGEMENAEILERMNSVLPCGVKIVAITQPESSANDISYALYEIKLTFEDEKLAEHFKSETETLIGGGSIIAEKPGKKGGRKIMKQVNICENVARLEMKTSGNIINMNAVFSAGNETNLNPALFTDTLKQILNVEIGDVQIKRKALMKSDFLNFS